MAPGGVRAVEGWCLIGALVAEFAEDGEHAVERAVEEVQVFVGVHGIRFRGVGRCGKSVDLFEDSVFRLGQAGEHDQCADREQDRARGEDQSGAAEAEQEGDRDGAEDRTQPSRAVAEPTPAPRLRVGNSSGV